jgi:trimethylamine--corrinoid protein Co-methyltransferase
LCFSLESLVVDNDLIGAVQRTMRGITVDDESISIETIRSTCVDGPGHYLGSDQTMHLMQRDYVYPAIGDRWSPNEWNSRGRPTYVSRAKAKTKALLDGHWPSHIAPAVDDAIRARFPVRLAAEAMRPPGV